MKYEDLFLMFGLKHGNSFSDVYIWTSKNGLDFVVGNNGNPVLTQDRNLSTIYSNIWNVSVLADGQTFHLLAETGLATDQSDVGLIYSSAVFDNGNINFDSNRTKTHIISGGGNPDIAIVRKEGRAYLFSIHGIVNKNNEVNTELNGEHWWIGASYTPLENAKTTWIDYSSSLYLGTKGIHVADPHFYVSQDSIILSFSYDQVMYIQYSCTNFLKTFFDFL